MSPRYACARGHEAQVLDGHPPDYCKACKAEDMAQRWPMTLAERGARSNTTTLTGVMFELDGIDGRERDPKRDGPLYAIRDHGELWTIDLGLLPIGVAESSEPHVITVTVTATPVKP